MSILADLFQEEDHARHMARQLMDIANQSKEAAARERASLLEFLNGPMERHMDYEERSLFPRLTKRGLGAEVSVAEKQHASLREKRAELAAIPAEDTATRADEIAHLIFDIARLMLHHTNFEGDYIYPELDKHDWAELMEETIH
jgi:iron-sulfur cluster repair protein YtfE (RIC family)